MNQQSLDFVSNNIDNKNDTIIEKPNKEKSKIKIIDFYPEQKYYGIAKLLLIILLFIMIYKYIKNIK